jgi:ribosomal protein S18 acetylase RimI-like enzyme
LNREIWISEFSYDRDLDAVLDLWEHSGDGIQLRASDRPEEIKKKLERDPDLFLVAMSGGELIGVVMGAFDGRRGHIYHLAVSDQFRRRGIASKLMDEVERRLKEKGCLRTNLLVTPDNNSAIDFYQNLGYEMMSVLPFGKNLT